MADAIKKNTSANMEELLFYGDVMSDYQKLLQEYKKLKEERDKYKFRVEQLESCLIGILDFNYMVKDRVLRLINQIGDKK